MSGEPVQEKSAHLANLITMSGEPVQEKSAHLANWQYEKSSTRSSFYLIQGEFSRACDQINIVSLQDTF